MNTTDKGKSLIEARDEEAGPIETTFRGLG